MCHGTGDFSTREESHFYLHENQLKGKVIERKCVELL